MNILGSKIFRTYRFIKNLPENLRVIRHDIRDLKEASKSLAGSIELAEKGFDSSIRSLDQDIEIVKQWQADMGSRMTETHLSKAETAKTILKESVLQADNHELDAYYLAFENNFRGTEEVIYSRLKESYSKLLSEGLSKDLRKMPIVDIGCGRGEMLKLLKDLKLLGIGIDLNKSMVDRCKRSGYEAKQQDALDFLREQPSSSLAAVVGIHIVEHIPFDQLLILLKECYRTVAPGGFVFFETPNPENVVVGSLTFWYDSSHLKPIPPEALAFALRYAGFSQTDIMRMHPEREIPPPTEGEEPLLKEIAYKIYGPCDYAAIGKKRKG